MQSEGALTVVEYTERGEVLDGDEDVTVHDDDGERDLEVVQPTEEWQTLKSGNVQ